MSPAPPVGTHVQAGRGLVTGALAQAGRLGCETMHVFAGNSRGWAHSAGDPALALVKEIRPDG